MTAKPEPELATARTISSLTVGGTYRTDWIPVRPGAQDHEQHPSRIGSRLIYRDGRVETLPCSEE